MKPIRLLATTLPIFFALPAHSAPRVGARPTEWPASPENHTTTIQREAADDHQKKLITAAEKSQPDAAALLEAIRQENADAKPQPGQWWNKEVHGIRIPFAITADAVQYYSDLVKTYGEQKLTRYAQPGSTFTYQAKVSQPAAYELNGKSVQNVSVVTMTLTFRQRFTATVAEAFGFEKTREVVFDKDGKIIHVQGDGDVRVPVMAM